MMSNVRKGRSHLTLWIRPGIKKELEAYFNNDEGFTRRCLTNVANRASPRSSKYTGGSATFMKTKSRITPSSIPHTLKANKERFTNEQSAAHYELHQQAEQSEQRYNNLFACMGGAIAISSDLTKKLEQLDRLREQMEALVVQMSAGASNAGGSSKAASGVPMLAHIPLLRRGITMTTTICRG
ncbi:hypothetical protein Ahy_B08g092537 [Arachis hypogaea]|uniref:Uncharacterized protein n=1 Tax=Arachis hypogaea TaxID=3818 RepID=A0A444Y4B4_ARAHY|nr:hypothetical protein Ahy_B08g092537 [Arachis hypogaea]